nr:hypothetical protein [Tanacetum cinerariifolium]
RFSKYKTAQELWAAILKTFSGNEATNKTKKNILKQQYDNFKAEGSKTLEQTFNRLQMIVSQLQFIDVEIEQDDLNQKFLTNLAQEWLMHMIVWRNMSDLDTMSLDDLYNHFKVYESEVDVEIEQDDLNHNFLTSLAPEWFMHTIVWRNRSDLDTMSLDDLYNHLKVYECEVQKKLEPNSQNMAFISSAKHSSGNEEVNIASGSTASINVSTASANIGINKDDMEEMDIKWNVALLSMRADRYWKKTGKKITIQGTDVAGAPRSQDKGMRDNYRQGSKVEEQAPKALMAIDGVGWDWSYIANDEENHALIADEETPTEFALMAKTSAESEVFDNSLCSKPTGLPEFKDDTVTNYSRPSPAIESTSDDAQNRNPSVTETEASPSTISSKPFIKFVKANDSPTKSKTDNVETAKKPPIKYVKQYEKPTKKPNVRRNQRNWNNLKSHHLGPNFVMKKKACFNCGLILTILLMNVVKG